MSEGSNGNWEKGEEGTEWDNSESGRKHEKMVVCGQVKTRGVRGKSSFPIHDPWRSLRKQDQEGSAEVFLWGASGSLIPF